MVVELGSEGEGGTLRLEWLEADELYTRLAVHLQDAGLSGAVDGLLDSLREPQLVRYFDEMARDWRGWVGRREWTGIDRCLTLQAQHDSKSSVLMTVILRPASTGLFCRELKGGIILDAGQLDTIAAQIRALLIPQAAGRW